MHKQESDPQPICVRNLTLVWFFISLAHFTIYSSVIVKNFAAESAREFQLIENAIGVPQSQRHAPAISFAEQQQYSALERLMSLPLLPALTAPKRDKHPSDSLMIPLTLRLLNSAAAGFILLIAGFFFTRPLAPDSSLSKFFDGRGLANGLPRFFDLIPLFFVSRKLEQAEKTRYGRVWAFAFFHFLLTIVSHYVAIADRVRDGSGLLSIFPRIMRFPLTPLLVSWEQWFRPQQNPGALFVLMVANSLLVAFAAAILIKAEQSLKNP
jgi:hypothetical protein